MLIDFNQIFITNAYWTLVSWTGFEDILPFLLKSVKQNFTHETRHSLKGPSRYVNIRHNFGKFERLLLVKTCYFFLSVLDVLFSMEQQSFNFIYE